MSDELERIRQRKLMEMQQRFEEQKQAEEQQNAMEAQKEMLLKKILTPEAKSRLTNIRIANPEFATQLEFLLLRVYQTGQVSKIDDSQLRKLLLKIKGNKKETKIIRK